ncbi:MAG: DUF4331 domain-containing protein [Acidobacteria bacterium]|nr:DUF4331 domain-containing protein [Acidobacteriota bacterium]
MKFKKLASRAMSAILTAGMLASNFGGIPSAQAADHRDSLAVDALIEGDFTDVYAFVDPANNNNVVLSFLVNPFTNPALSPSMRFSEEYLYQMKIDNGGDAREDLVMQVKFEGGRGQQHYEVVLGAPAVTGPRGNRHLANGRKLCTGNAVYSANAAIPYDERDRFIAPSGTLPDIAPYNGRSAGTADEAGVKCFAGITDDSFQTDVAQFVFRTGLNSSTTENALTHTQDVARGFTSTSFGPLRGRPTRADGTSGSDGFGGFNASAVAVSIPKHLLTGTGIADVSQGGARNADLIGVWGTVSRPESESFDGVSTSHSDTYAQFERMGQQLANTVWVFATAPINETQMRVSDANAVLGAGYIPGAASALMTTALLKDLHNATGPETDAALFRRYTPTSLRSGGIGSSLSNTIEGRQALLTGGGFTAPAVTGVPLLLPEIGLDDNQNQNLQKDITWPDYMRLNVNLPTDGVRPGAATDGNSSATLAIGTYGYQNGRRPADDVTDIYLRLARELTDVQFGPNVLLGGSTVGGNPLPGYQPNTDPSRRPLRCEQINVDLSVTDSPALLTPCEDARIFTVLQGTDFIESNPLDIINVANQVSKERKLEASFPYFGLANPMPGERGTNEFSAQK